MRRFYLENEIGKYFYFEGNTLIAGIDGLGLTREINYLNYQGTFKKSSYLRTLSQITMQIVFVDGYEGYNNFLEYIERSEKLKLFYESVDTKYLNVEFVSITKGELSFNALQCELKFDRLSNYIKTVSYDITSQLSSKKKVYPAKYTYTYGSQSSGGIRIANNGTKPASTYIKIIGLTNTPTIRLKHDKNDRDEDSIQTLRMNVTTNYGTIEVSSVPDDSYIHIYGYDAYQRQDFTCTNFITIPVGEYYLEFIPGSSVGSTCHIVVYEEYGGN
jgi:hypothetical protein